MDQRDDFVRTSLRIPKELWERLGEAAGRKRSLNAEIIARLEASFEATTVDPSYSVDHILPKGLAPTSDANLMLVDQNNFGTFVRLQIGEAIEQTMQRLVAHRHARALGLVHDGRPANTQGDTYAPKRRKPSRQRAKQMQEEAEDAPIFRRASPGIRAMWAKKAAARKRKHARKPSVASLTAGQGPVDSDSSYSAVQATPKPAIASDAPAQSDPRAGTSLSTKPVKSRGGVRIERRYVRPSMGAYERFSRSARDAEASKAELEALQAKYPATPNIAPLSAPNMEKLLRTGVRPAKMPEKVEKALTLRKAAAKESRIRDPNEPRPVKARKKAPKDENPD